MLGLMGTVHAIDKNGSSAGIRSVIALGVKSMSRRYPTRADT